MIRVRPGRKPWLSGLVVALGLLVWGEVGEGGGGCDPSTFPVAVDAGHGPRRCGAESARGVPEYVFNFRLAGQVVDALRQAGFARAALLDPAGEDLPPAARAARAKARGAGLLVSVHHDSVQPRYLQTWSVDGRSRRFSDRFAGYSLFFSGASRQAEASLALARLIASALRQAGLPFTRHHAEPIPGENRTLVDDAVGVYRYDGLAVLRDAAMPAVLVEAGVIVNRDEESALAGPARRQATAEAIARGVAGFCRREAARPDDIRRP